jgi:hypothetical protein
MTLKKDYKEKTPGILFSDIVLDLVSYPRSYPCCITIPDTGIDLMYIGNKTFKLISINNQLSTKLFIDNKILVKGTKFKKVDCKPQE